MKIYVIFDADEDVSILENTTAEDYVVGVPVSGLNCTFIDVNHVTLPDHELGALSMALIDKLPPPLSRSISPYINNLYECSIIPIFRYYSTLKQLIEKHHNDIEEVVLQSAQQRIKTSTYYMAEHESQGYRWYHRGSVFGGYIADYVRSNNIKCRIIQNKKLYRVIINRFFRIYAVLGIKFIKSLLELLCHSSKDKLSSSAAPQIIAVSRAQPQSKFLLPYILNSRLQIEFALGESTIDFGGNNRWINNQNTGDIQLRSIYRKSDGLKLIVNYFRCLMMLWRMPNKVTLSLHGAELNLADAFREIVVMSPELSLYQDVLTRHLTKVIETDKLSALFTTEQKSPHAYIDALVANNIGIKCLQFMSCNQAYSYIPKPVAGDVYITDTNYSKYQFLDQFPHEPFDYVGSLKGIVDTNNNHTKKYVCYFTTPKLIEINKQVITTLLKTSFEPGLQVVVKLHPRDKIARYNEFSGLTIFEHAKVDSEILNQQIAMAITCNSGVVMDLLYQSIPYILIRFRQEDRLNVPYTDEEYMNVCRNIEQLNDILSDQDKISAEFLAFRERFITRNDIIVEINTIDNAISKLI